METDRWRWIHYLPIHKIQFRLYTMRQWYGMRLLWSDDAGGSVSRGARSGMVASTETVVKLSRVAERLALTQGPLDPYPLDLQHRYLSSVIRRFSGKTVTNVQVEGMACLQSSTTIN